MILSSFLVPWFYNVLYIPQFHVNSLSVLVLLHSSNCSLSFSNCSFVIQDLASKKEIGKSDQLGGLYVLQPVSSLSSLPSLVSLVTVDTWHARLGHLSIKVLNNVSPHISDFPLHFDHMKCSICPLAKLRRLSFSSRNNMFESSFDLVHYDIWRPYSLPTYDGKRYFLTIVDNHSRFTWIYLMHSKSKGSSLLINFVNLIET